MKTAAFALALIVSTIPAFAAPTLKSVCGSNRECVKQAQMCVKDARAAEAKGWRSAAGHPVTLQDCLNDMTEDSGSEG